MEFRFAPILYGEIRDEGEVRITKLVPYYEYTYFNEARGEKKFAE